MFAARLALESLVHGSSDARLSRYCAGEEPGLSGKKTYIERNGTMPEINAYGALTPIPIPYEEGDGLIHTVQSPFCGDLSCGCHEDQDALGVVGGQVYDGLLTPVEADRLFRGQTP